MLLSIFDNAKKELINACLLLWIRILLVDLNISHLSKSNDEERAINY